MMSTATDRRRRPLRRTVVIGAVLGVAASGLVFAAPADAAVPTFPDNILIFPDRDFVSVQGYAQHAGETATLTLTRGTTVLGSAKAVVSGTDVAFEVNHPGGVCWGAGTSLQVTPDIKAGDVAKITFSDGTSDDTTASSATVTKDAYLDPSDPTNKTVLVDGTYDTDPAKQNPDFLEQRIVNPDLTPIIGVRSIRAVPGPVTPVTRGGYSSGLNVANGKFTATYVFDGVDAVKAAATTIASTLGERAISWQALDGAGNRQGMTLAEFGEGGGPLMGNCPQGPANQAAPAGTASAIRSADKASAVIKWTAATAQPGAAAVTGYSVEAVDTATNAVQGIRIGDPTATSTTLSKLDPAATYTFEVRSMAGDAMSVPFGAQAAAGTPATTTMPTLKVTPDGGPTSAAAAGASSVSASSDGQIFYTTDGSSVIEGDGPSLTAKVYSGPITITGPTKVDIAAFNQVGNHVLGGGYYQPVSVTAPATPTGLAGAATQASVALSWSAVTGADSYQVTVYDANGVKLANQPAVTQVPKQPVSGLTAGTTYQFTVSATNAGGTSGESPKVSVKTDAATDQITIKTAKWKVGDFRIVGTGSVVGNTVTAYKVNADGSIGAAYTGAATDTVVAAAPPAVGGTYAIRIQAGAPATNPGKVYVKSNVGGIAGPFPVANG